MLGRGIVLTTTNKNRLDEVLGEDSHAVEVVGRAKDLHDIDLAIKSQTDTVRKLRQTVPIGSSTKLSTHASSGLTLNTTVVCSSSEDAPHEPVARRRPVGD